MLYNPEYGQIELHRSNTEKLLRSFPGNILGTFYKISDQGMYEQAMFRLKEDRKIKAKESLEVDKTIAGMTKEEKLLLMEIAPRIRTRIRKSMLREENTAFSRSLSAARSKREIAIVLDLFGNEIEEKTGEK